MTEYVELSNEELAATEGGVIPAFVIAGAFLACTAAGAGTGYGLSWWLG